MRVGLGIGLGVMGGELWTPEKDPDLAAWFDPNDNTAGAIASWTKKAGSIAWTVTQATPGQQPTAIAGASVGRGAAVRYVKTSSQWLRCNTGDLNQPSTVLTIIKPTSLPGADNYTLVDGKDLNTRRIYNYAAGPNPALFSGANLVETTVQLRQGIWSCVAGVFNGASSIIRAYNTTDGTHQIQGNAGTSVATGITLGNTGNGADDLFDGDMGHVIVIARAMTAAEIDTVFAWIRTAP